MITTSGLNTSRSVSKRDQHNMVYIFIATLTVAVCCLIPHAHGQHSPPCDDLDTQGCLNNPSLCQDPALASLMCPKTCNKCPFLCYHCDKTVPDYTLCNQTKECQNGQACLMRHLVSFVDGHHEYTMKCVDLQTCDNRRRSSMRRDVTTHCCTTDLCNHPLQTITKSTMASTTTSTTLPTTSTTRSTSTVSPTTKPTQPTQTTYVHVPRTHHPTTTTTTQTRFAGCKKDIILVLDESCTMKGEGNIKQFFADIIGPLQISPFHNLLALLTTNPSHTVAWNLNTFKDKSSLLGMVYNMPRDPAYMNFASDTMVGVRAYLDAAQWPSFGNRYDVDDVVVIVTASNWHPTMYSLLSHHSPAENLAGLHAACHDVIAIGIGDHDTNENQLYRLATTNNHWMHIRNTGNLSNIKDKVLDLICP